MFLRLAFLVMIFYSTIKILAAIFKPKPPSNIAGKSQSKPLDVPDDKIQDVDFKEVDE